MTPQESDEKKQRVMMFSIIDSLMQSVGPKAVDWLLHRIDVENLNSAEISGLLSATWPAKSVLESRGAFHDAAVFTGQCDMEFMRMME